MLVIRVAPELLLNPFLTLLKVAPLCQPMTTTYSLKKISFLPPNAKRFRSRVQTVRRMFVLVVLVGAFFDVLTISDRLRTCFLSFPHNSHPELSDTSSFNQRLTQTNQLFHGRVYPKSSTT
jgi:hypothetical protein